MTPATRFEVPPGRLATRPPERRGVDRDGVRLLVAAPGRIEHRTFRQLPDVLEPGDLVVVNTSATIPAAVDATRTDGRPVVVHHAGALDDGSWVVELRRPDGAGPVLDGRPGEVVTWASGTRVRLVAPHTSSGARLWRARIGLDGPVEDELARVGRPIVYGYLEGRYGIDAYQPVFGRDPGSAEMASAGRPFTDAMVTALVTRGIGVVPVLLHAGVSSPEAGEHPQAERYRVPPVTARAVERTRADGGRVVAIGTTVTRALETVARPDGRVVADEGWTELVLGPDRPARVVDGLVTGWHEPEASHLLLLEAVAGPDLVGAAYAAAVAGDYLWHEFGDSCLLLPRSGWRGFSDDRRSG